MRYLVTRDDLERRTLGAGGVAAQGFRGGAHGLGTISPMCGNIQPGDGAPLRRHTYEEACVVHKGAGPTPSTARWSRRAREISSSSPPASPTSSSTPATGRCGRPPSTRRPRWSSSGSPATGSWPRPRAHCGRAICTFTDSGRGRAAYSNAATLSSKAKVSVISGLTSIRPLPRSASARG
jgi:hypothetical protein